MNQPVGANPPTSSFRHRIKIYSSFKHFGFKLPFREKKKLICVASEFPYTHSFLVGVKGVFVYIYLKTPVVLVIQLAGDSKTYTSYQTGFF